MQNCKSITCSIRSLKLTASNKIMPEIKSVSLVSLVVLTRLAPSPAWSRKSGFSLNGTSNSCHLRIQYTLRITMRAMTRAFCSRERFLST
jgi:hypothetical protein